jgi:tetratricopeptide (TPR) repeat protein
MQLLFSFTPEDAARSFREAHRRDSTCAMCYWGEALAWGPYLNGGMQRDAAPRAHAAIARAQQLGTHAGPVERDLIEALATRYSATHDPKTRVRLDSAYARAMARAYEAHPADLDVATWYAESLMLLEPRRGTWSLEKPSVREILRVLEGVLARDVTHPGACHLLIHATESTTVPGKAEACADHLGHSIPGASHINHMPSHTYNRLGRWGDAVRANLEAWHSDQRAAVGEGFAIYPSHNLHMLLFAASMDGQGAVAIQAARDYARLVKGGVGYVALALARFGRFTEVLELEQTPDDPTYRGFWDFARGYAHLRAGDPDNGRVYLERLDRAASTLPDTTRFRWHATRDLLSVLGGILRAELLRQGGKPDAAIAALERAVEVEDGLTYDEPEPLVFSARHFLGAALLDARRPGEAERVYRASLADHPNNGWSLLGLEQSLRAQGRQAEAAEIRTAFTRAWARSDTWVRQSRF